MSGDVLGKGIRKGSVHKIGANRDGKGSGSGAGSAKHEEENVKREDKD